MNQVDSKGEVYEAKQNKGSNMDVPNRILDTDMVHNNPKPGRGFRLIDTDANRNDS